MIDETVEWRWEARSPPICGHEGTDLTAAPEWIDTVWRLRGLVLYDEGRRPQFRQSDGSISDRDTLDLVAYHVLGWCAGELVGCIRFVPVASPLSSLTERVLGAQELERVLESLQTTRRATVDVGRWTVHPNFRRHQVAMWLVGACWAYVRQLGFEFAVATVGTRGGQDIILQRAGLIPVSGLGPSACQDFDDELCTMYGVAKSPAANFSGLIARMAECLIVVPAPSLTAAARDAA